MAKKKPVVIKMGLAEWMGTYGDMVTLLLCFFVLLFSMSSVDVSKFKAMVASFNNNTSFLEGGTSYVEGSLVASGVSQLTELDIFFVNVATASSDAENKEAVEDYLEGEEKQKLQQAEEISEELKEAMKLSNISDEVVISYTSQYIQLSLKGAILFDSGEAVLKKEALDLLKQLASILKVYEEHQIEIEGHTDSVPMSSKKYPSNWHLSSARAIEVAQFFINSEGFLPENLSAVGYGEYKPVASNDTAEGKAANRRVEIKIKNTLINNKQGE